MSVKDKAQGVLGGAVVERLGGERPGPLRAVAGAAVAGGITGVVVYRLLRRGGEEES
jgi:hypothetical protein